MPSPNSGANTTYNGQGINTLTGNSAVLGTINLPALATTPIFSLSPIFSPNEGQWTILLSFFGAVNAAAATTLAIKIAGNSVLPQIALAAGQTVFFALPVFVVAIVGPRVDYSANAALSIQNSGANAASLLGGSGYSVNAQRNDLPTV